MRLKEDYKKLYEIKLMENKRLEAELKGYIAAQKEEIAKRSEAVEMVQILKTTKDGGSKIWIKIDKLSRTEKYDKQNKKNANRRVTKGKPGGFKGNNKPTFTSPKQRYPC